MKHIHRFFVNEILSSGQAVRLSSDDTFHASRVLRLRPGDHMELADADCRAFLAEVTQVGGRVEAMVGDELPQLPATSLHLTVIQAVPKGKKMDLVVEKLSEIGVGSLVPVYMDDSLARLNAAGGGRLDRWRRIARASAGQSRRAGVMEIAEPVSFAGWIQSWNGPLIVLATEIDGAPLGSAAEKAESPLALLVGPEAGFSEEEIGLLQERDAIFASLGGQVLRTETAALVAAAIVMHRLGGLG